MTINEHIQHWIDSAENDLETANILFNSKRYDWCLFISHLVVEKAVKAVFVLNNDNKIPPKTHNLLKLAKNSNLDLSKEQELLFKEISSFNIEARYPQYKQEFYKLCNREFTIKYFNKIKDIFKWIKYHIESKKL
jgi:HEPN domain-containing protein